MTKSLKRVHLIITYDCAALKDENIDISLKLRSFLEI